MPSPALQISQAHKRYEDVHAVRGIDLTIQPGEFYALLGMNGAGKSSLIHMITGLSTISEGSIKIFGHDMAKNPGQAKQHLGLVPQEFNFPVFFKVNQIIENYAGYHGIARKEAQARLDPILDRLGLLQKKESYARHLSGGMKRRLMIARALIHTPKLLILDEPTAGVDIELRSLIWELLTDLNKQGTTIILTTHYMEEAEALCKRVGVIDHGKLLIEGPMKECLLSFNEDTWELSFTAPIGESLEGLNCPHRLVDDMTLHITVDSTEKLQCVLHKFCQLNRVPVRLKNVSNRLEALLKHHTGSHRNED